MSIDALKKKKLPDAPGVYFFLGGKSTSGGYKGHTVLYVGKATSLRDRTRSYFARDLIDTRGPGIVQMVEDAEDIAFEQTDSVLEALLLEADIIRRFKPRYNSKEKDNKSYNYVVITKEAYPRVLIVRERDVLMEKFDAKTKHVFGPFPHGTQLKEALKIVRKIFPFRDRCVPFEANPFSARFDLAEKPSSVRPCFNYQIGLCPGVCIGAISKEDYSQTIENIALFFSGRKKALVKKLNLDMKAAAALRAFERAEQIKRTIFALTHIQDVALIKDDYRMGAGREALVRLEGYDIAHLGGDDTVGVMTVVENGQVKKSDYRMFKLRHAKPGDDVGALAEILERRLTHIEWPLPHIIVIDGGKAQKNRAEKIVHGADAQIKIVSVVKDEFHRPREILGERGLGTKFEKDIILVNSEAHRFAIGFHRKRRTKNFLPGTSK